MNEASTGSARTDRELAARLRLANALPFRPALALGLVADWGSAAAVLEQSPAALASTGRLGAQEAGALLAACRGYDADTERRLLERLGARLVWKGGPGYPAALDGIPDAPAALYVRGELSDTPALAIVGTRRATFYGKRMAASFAKNAALAGMPVVSGLARGIDTAAHTAAVEAGGRTWAVLGTGLCHTYPSENAKLVDRIVETGGAVVTEFPPQLGPDKPNFPRRNRIVSGLCFGTLVVEGPLQSGALITARCALDQGREVFAVPGPADAEMSAGPHHLLQQGAKLAAKFLDVVEELDLFSSVPSPQPSPARGEGESPILDAIGAEARSFDELALATGLAAPQLAEQLLDLEIRGALSALPGQRYARRN